MKVWIATCVILFVLVELYQSVKGFILPLPIYVLAGAFLSIASNYNRGIDELWHRETSSDQQLSQTVTLVDVHPTLEAGTSPQVALKADKTSDDPQI